MSRVGQVRVLGRVVLMLSIVLAMTAGAGTRQTSKKTVAELQRFAEDILVSLRSKDIDRVISYYDHSSHFVHIENGSEKKWPKLEKEIRQFLSVVKENNLTWEGQPQVIVLSPEVAVIYGRHRFSATLADGRSLPPHSGAWSGVVKRTSSGWKIVYSHSSEDVSRTPDRP